MSARLPQAADFIKTHQNPDGGWGYGPGRASLVEPTGMAVLALHERGDIAAAGRGLAFLKAVQKPSGAVGIDPRDADGCWMAYAALLAYHAMGAGEEEERLKAWALAFEDASGRFSKEDISAISSRFRYDASIPGWAWTPRTTAWTEPTALFVMALLRAGVPGSEKRIRSGVELILDRRVPSGGWNFGNPYSKAYELEATALSTALALAALGAAGVPEGRPAVAAGIRFLEKGLSAEVSTVSLAWILLALKSYPEASGRMIPEVGRLLSARQADDGGFRGNIFETALAFLVLSDASILKPAAWKGQ